MDLVGRTLAHYQVTAFLGRGGMGEVYRARDTKLDRDVAIKILPADTAGDPERLARFDREARTLATINHPNVAQIYGTENVDGVRLLAMEFVEGEDLAQRLRHGAFDVDEALEIAIEIAAGLEEAHRQGVVHRDLKPANVKLTPEGRVKILDFGLARAFAGDAVSESDPALSPTITQAMTQAGTILGSAAYMSPEQARGRRVDKRADLWAFGVILYEMLGGRRLFDADTTTDVLAAVLRADIDLDALPANVPPRVRRVLSRCLERDPDARQRDAGDVRLDLLERERAAGAGSTGRGRGAPIALLGAIGILALFLGVLVGRGTTSDPATEDWRAFRVEGPQFLDPGAISIRADGRQIVYRGSGVDAPLTVLDLDGSAPRTIPGTEGAGSTFYSPDGEFIGYFTTEGLYRCRLDGSSRRQLSRRSGQIAVGVWAPNDSIYFATASLAIPQSAGVVVIGADGGEERIVTVPNVDENELAHGPTDLLGDGERILVTVFRRNGLEYDTAVLDLATGTMKVGAGYHGLSRWSPTGHLLVASIDQDALLALPFDPESARVTGNPITLVEGIGMPAVASFGFDVADVEGTLVYGNSETGDLGESLTEVIEIAPGGESVALPIGDGNWDQPSLDPTGSRLAVRRVQSVECDIWTFDPSTGAGVRLSLEGDDHDPLWLPGGGLAYVRRTEASADLVVFDRVPGPERVVLSSAMGIELTSITPDGRRFVVTATSQRPGESGIYLVDAEAGGDAELRPWLVRDTSDTDAQVAPAGDWVAHVSRVDGRDNVFLRRLDDVDTAFQVSATRGMRPRWSPDGSTLFYLDGEHVMATTVENVEGALTLSRARSFGDLEAESFGTQQFRAIEGGILATRPVESKDSRPYVVFLVGLEARLREPR